MTTAIHSFRVLALALLLPLVAALPAAVHAQVPPLVPAGRFYGTLLLNGQPAPYGTTVTAQAGSGTICGTGYVNDSLGDYSVDIQPYGGCAGTIFFTINGQTADQTAVLPNFLSGASQLNLSVSTYGYGTPYLPPPPYPPSSPYPPSYGYGASVTYAAGWNLIGLPAGTSLPGVNGPLYTLRRGDTSYETVPSGTPLRAGRGYWALFTTPVTITVPPSSQNNTRFPVTPGQFALIGNPFNTPARVSGASAVYTYDPVRGYQPTTLLQPGQGAWAVSTSGRVTIDPAGY